MKTFLFINIIITAFNIFILAYAYSLRFFPLKWRKKVNQDTLVGLAIIFVTMLNMFAWIIYFYYEIFDPFKDLKKFFA
tara:strand:+ start:865 stop:1098 length:234 start_codon:yes stop_codon:yes gene_type:complete